MIGFMNALAETTRIKWQNKFTNFTAALARLEEATKQDRYSYLEKAGLVKTFEFTFELAWKALRALLQYRGYDAVSPRDVLKEAYKNGLLSDGEVWLNALDNRNLLVHTYDEETTDTAVLLIKEKYFPALKKLHAALSALVSSDVESL